MLRRPEGDLCHAQGDIAEHVFILKHGLITEMAGEDVRAIHRASDVFGCEVLAQVRLVYWSRHWCRNSGTMPVRSNCTDIRNAEAPSRYDGQIQDDYDVPSRAIMYQTYALRGISTGVVMLGNI